MIGVAHTEDDVVDWKVVIDEMFLTVFWLTNVVKEQQRGSAGTIGGPAHSFSA